MLRIILIFLILVHKEEKSVKAEKNVAVLCKIEVKRKFNDLLIIFELYSTEYSTGPDQSNRPLYRLILNCNIG